MVNIKRSAKQTLRALREKLPDLPKMSSPFKTRERAATEEKKKLTDEKKGLMREREKATDNIKVQQQQITKLKNESENYRRDMESAIARDNPQQADVAERKMKAANEGIKKAENSIAKSESKIKEIDEDIQEIDEEIEKLMRELDKILEAIGIRRAAEKLDDHSATPMTSMPERARPAASTRLEREASRTSMLDRSQMSDELSKKMDAAYKEHSGGQTPKNVQGPDGKTYTQYQFKDMNDAKDFFTKQAQQNPNAKFSVYDKDFNEIFKVENGKLIDVKAQQEHQRVVEVPPQAPTATSANANNPNPEDQDNTRKNDEQAVRQYTQTQTHQNPRGTAVQTEPEPPKAPTPGGASE